MDVKKTVKHIKSICESYTHPDSVIININKDYFITKSKSDYIFINCGLLIIIPFFNEVDIFTADKEEISLTEEEFRKYGPLGEKYFGILIKENQYIIGVIDLCNCNINSRFKPLEKSNDSFYNKLDEIVKKIIKK